MIAFRVAVAVVLAAWLALTILGQFSSKRVQRVMPSDSLRLIPKWTFFAPTPGTSDYHLLYRTLDEQGHYSQFLEIPMNGRGRWAFVWNPSKRTKKALLDLSNMIQRLLASPDWNLSTISGSLPYLALLNYLAGIERGSSVVALQFSIFATAGPLDSKPPRLVLASEFHGVR